MEFTLNDARKDIADRLAEAASSRRSEMHTPVVTTADASARVMVLRHYDEAAHTLRFHTDARAPKCATIAADPRMGVLFYDREAKVQLRCMGEGRVETSGPVVDAAWAQANEYARRCYLAVNAPGAEADAATSGLPLDVEGIKPSEEQLLPARENFAVLIVSLHSVDWLYLAHDGHRRAQFDLAAGQGSWVIP